MFTQNNSNENRSFGCQEIRYNGFPCGKDLFDDKRCIFHSKDIYKKKALFKDNFSLEIERQKKEDNVFDFSGFIFPDSIEFIGEVFNKDTYFVAASFLGETTLFLNAQFLGEKTSFKNAYFIGHVDFTGALFSGKEADFSEVIFLGKTSDFTGTQFNSELTKLDNAKINSKRIFLTKSYLNNITGLSDAITIEKKYLFIKLKKYNIDNFCFILGDRTAKENPILSLRSKESLLLYEFKERHPFLYFLWWISSDCGRSIARWMACCLIIISVFGWIYADVPYPSWLENIDKWHLLEKINPIIMVSQTNSDKIYARKPTAFTPYYLSVITFTTLGFGDVVPVNLAGEIFIAIEVFIGYIMLGGLISIFTTRFVKKY